MFLNFRPQNGTEWGACVPKGRRRTEMYSQLKQEAERLGVCVWHPQRGRGVGTLRGCPAGAVGQAWGLGEAGRHREGGLLPDTV